MTLADIEAIDVRSIADIDCWLFLWATTALLPQAIDVLRAWGFRYSGTAFTWAKLTRAGTAWHMGLGYTTRKNPELCLLGRRGKPAILDHGVRELIVAPVRQHSQKPDEQYERIERLCAGPRIELFARSRRSGWTSWGNEVDGRKP